MKLLKSLFKSNLIFALESETQRLAFEKISTLNMLNNNTNIGSSRENLLKIPIESNSILIDEDHFTKKVLYFINSLSLEIYFENFICKIDRFSVKTIEKLNDKESNEFIRSDSFSFFELKPTLLD